MSKIKEFQSLMLLLYLLNLSLLITTHEDLFKKTTFLKKGVVLDFLKEYVQNMIIL